MLEEKFKMLVGRYQFSKTGTVFMIAVLMLICLYMRPMFLPTGFVSKHDSKTVSLKELLVAAIQAAERGGDQVKKIKEEHNLQVSKIASIFHCVTWANAQNFWPKLNILFHNQISVRLMILSVIKQKGESQKRCCKKTKPAKFTEKGTFLTLWYAHACILIRG